MSPYNATKNTNVCSANPTAVGHPLGDATDPPNSRLPIAKAVGLANIKNKNVVYNEYLNFNPSESAIVFLMSKELTS
jgi:hypothetical protein